MARLVVQYTSEANVAIDGVAAGETNRVIRVPSGEHRVELIDQATDPPFHTLNIDSGADPDAVERLAFHPATQPIERFSPLYCRYNGFLLGQFLSLIFSSIGRQRYAERRARMLEFLKEISVDVDVPEEPLELAGQAHVDLLTDVLTKLRPLSSELTDFTLLGALLVHHGLIADSDPDFARTSLEQLERLRIEYELPELNIDRFIAKGDTKDPDEVLSPSLAYLSEAVDKLAVESDTAFVIMPFKQPYASYFAEFYRPSLEECGFRAFRAWGGLSNEDYCELLLKLISKSGFVWADLSELNYNVLYEIGAAHAFGKLAVLVVREDMAETVPANIGHDAVMRYSTTDDWPQGTVLLMAALISSLQVAAERGEKMRVKPESVEAALQAVGERLKALLIPPEAQAASSKGLDAMSEGDYAGAEKDLDDAIQLGLDNFRTRAARASARLSLGLYAAAEADLTAALNSDEWPADTADGRDLRSATVYLRGTAREFQKDYASARADYQSAAELDYPDPSVWERKASVNLVLNNLDEAAKDIEKFRELSPTAVSGYALQGDLLVRQARYQEAIEMYDQSLAIEDSNDVKFSRALALLLDGKPEEALTEYRQTLEAAEPEQIDWALSEFDRLAPAVAGAADCRAILLAKK